MAQEINHKTLQRAINQLPQYTPEAQVWLTLEQELGTLASEETLHVAIEGLPSYAPSASLWGRIAIELEQPVRKPLFVRRWVQLASAAALAGAVISLAIWLNQPKDPITKESIFYAQTESMEAVNADWDEDDALIDNVAKAYAQRASFLQNKDPNLLSELEELNEAKAEIKAMMQKYGRDAELIQNIVEIERERTTVAKQMAQEI